MTDADLTLVRAIRETLAGAGDPERAAAQRRYMKSEMPFRGITSPELTALLRPLMATYDPASRAAWEATVRSLWDDATHREERYAALVLAKHRAARSWRDPSLVPLVRHLVVTGAWWDLVDDIAVHLAGAVLAEHPDEMAPVVRAWAADDDQWLRRTAVLCQLGRRADTDLDLLRYTVECNVDDESFWLRKAIGWALRDLARTDPEWVLAEVDRLDGRLSPLSRREALKHLS